MDYSRRIQVHWNDEDFKYPPKNDGCSISLYAQQWIEIPPREGLTIKVKFDVNIPIGFMGYIFGSTELGYYGVLFNNTVIPSDGWHRVSISVFNPSDDIVHIGEGERIAHIMFIESHPIRLIRKRNKAVWGRRKHNETQSNSTNGQNGIGEINGTITTSEEPSGDGI